MFDVVAYRARVADKIVPSYLAAFGAVVVEGARATGKTSTALQHSRSSVRLDVDPSLVDVAHVSPDLILAGDAPRLVDEWQLVPSLWNVIRHEVDARQAKGQFILSGSATPDDDVTRHTGAGRFGRFRMRPMSLQESGVSSGAVSLSELAAESGSVAAVSDVSYRDVAVQAVRGGWPGLLSVPDEAAELANASYLEDLVKIELPVAVDVRHDPVRVRRLIASMARNLATEMRLSGLAADVNADGGETRPATLRTYLDDLERVFVAEPQPAWSVSLRSRSRLRTTEKIHFVDPSLACAALQVGPDRLARDPEYFGFVFESMVVRDLRVYASRGRGKVFHYRDNTGLEVDAIIEFPGGVWGAVEVKLGEQRLPEAEATLLKLARERVDTARVGEPAFLAVITTGKYARTLPSGVHVIPLATLGP